MTLIVLITLFLNFQYFSINFFYSKLLYIFFYLNIYFLKFTPSYFLKISSSLEVYTRNSNISKVEWFFKKNYNFNLFKKIILLLISRFLQFEARFEILIFRDGEFDPEVNLIFLWWDLWSRDFSRDWKKISKHLFFLG